MSTFKYNGEIIYCPKCGSNKLIAEENPYDVEMGLLGQLVFGPGGLALGEEENDITLITCLKCGYEFEVD